MLSKVKENKGVPKKKVVKNGEAVVVKKGEISQ